MKALPGEVLPSAGVYITGRQLDVRTVFDDELDELAQIIKQCLHNMR